MNLRDELAGMVHPERMRRVVEAGQAREAGLVSLEQGDTFARWMALKGCYGSRDGAHVLRAMQDPSRQVRQAALKLVALCCDDDQAFEAARLSFETRGHLRVLAALRRRRRFAPIDRFLDWLQEQPGDTRFADVVPYGSVEAIQRHLGRALERDGFQFWSRLRRQAPASLAGLLLAQLEAIPGHPDGRLRWLIDTSLAELAVRVPDATIPLWSLLRRRGVPMPWRVEEKLLHARPAQVFDRLVEIGWSEAGPSFQPVAFKLDRARLLDLIRRSAGRAGEPQVTLNKLPPAERAEVARVWARSLLERKTPRMLLSCLPFLEGELREQVHAAWSHAAQDKDGVIGLAVVKCLPEDLASREARRHLEQVTQLVTRPSARLPYAELLPWEDALEALREHMGHPEAEIRGPAVATALRAAGRTGRPEVHAEALRMVLDRCCSRRC
jgi:hypothetical protein